jgi:hypothetical protein
MNRDVRSVRDELPNKKGARVEKEETFPSDAVLAREQAAFLRDEYDKIDNLREEVEHGAGGPAWTASQFLTAS